MSYQRGKRRGKKAGTFGAVVGAMVFGAGLFRYPATPVKWFLVGGVVCVAVAIVSLILMKTHPAAGKKGGDS